MISPSEYVELTPESVVVPEGRAPACRAALRRKANRNISNIFDALRHFEHIGELRHCGDVEIESIRIEVWSSDIERLYQILAMFVSSGGKIHCTDEPALFTTACMTA